MKIFFSEIFFWKYFWWIFFMKYFWWKYFWLSSTYFPSHFFPSFFQSHSPPSSSLWSARSCLWSPRSYLWSPRSCLWSSRSSLQSPWSLHSFSHPYFEMITNRLTQNKWSQNLKLRGGRNKRTHGPDGAMFVPFIVLD